MSASAVTAAVGLRPLRVAHFTDIHFHRFPSFGELLSHPKRWIGVANLYGAGRHNMFSIDVQRACVQTIIKLKPDVCVLSGDLTAIGTDSEFELARRELQPLTSRVRTFMIPGNHDTYIPRAVQTERFQHFFGEFMGAAAAGDGGGGGGGMRTQLFHTPNRPSLQVIGLNPCRPTLIGSAGFYPPHQLTAFERFITHSQPATATAAATAASTAAPAAVKPFVLLATHYPILHYSGKAYDRVSRFHSVSNGSALIDILNRTPAASLPDLIVHGHEHRGFTTPLVTPNGAAVPIINPGASGNSFSEGAKPPKAGQFGSKRYAAFHVYDIHATGSAGSALYRLETNRYVHNGSEFVRQNVPYKEKHGTTPIRFDP